MEELKRIREEAGLSQAQLARESGVDRATINKIEQGKRSPSIATLESLSRVLAVEMADFFPKAQAPLPNFEDERREDRGFTSASRSYRLPPPQDLEQRRESARRLMDAGVSESTARAVSGIDHRSEDWWREWADIVFGQDISEISTTLEDPKTETRAVFRELVEENRRLKAEVTELRNELSKARETA